MKNILLLSTILVSLYSFSQDYEYEENPESIESINSENESFDQYQDKSLNGNSFQERAEVPQSDYNDLDYSEGDNSIPESAPQENYETQDPYPSDEY